MSIKKLILKHGIDIFVALVLLSYIVMDVKTPAIMNKTSETIIAVSYTHLTLPTILRV